MIFNIMHDLLSTMPKYLRINIQGLKMKEYGEEEETNERTSGRMNKRRKHGRKKERNKGKQNPTIQGTTIGTNERKNERRIKVASGPEGGAD
jgi:hypothetical protein